MATMFVAIAMFRTLHANVRTECGKTCEDPGEEGTTSGFRWAVVGLREAVRRRRVLQGQQELAGEGLWQSHC